MRRINANMNCTKNEHEWLHSSRRSTECKITKLNRTPANAKTTKEKSWNRNETTSCEIKLTTKLNRINFTWNLITQRTSWRSQRVNLLPERKRETLKESGRRAARVLDACKRKAKNLCKNSNQQSKYVEMNVYANYYCMCECYLCEWVSESRFYALCSAKIYFDDFSVWKVCTSLTILYRFILRVCVCVSIWTERAWAWAWACMCYQLVLLPFSHLHGKWSKMKLMPSVSCIVIVIVSKTCSTPKTKINVWCTHIHAE